MKDLQLLQRIATTLKSRVSGDFCYGDKKNFTEYRLVNEANFVPKKLFSFAHLSLFAAHYIHFKNFLWCPDFLVETLSSALPWSEYRDYRGLSCIEKSANSWTLGIRAQSRWLFDWARPQLRKPLVACKEITRKVPLYNFNKSSFV